MNELRTVERWFTRERLKNGITRIQEPHVDEFLRSNIWHIAGSERDLVVDAGLGIVSLRAELPDLFTNSPILVITHAHLDHMGSAYEFADRRAHPAEPLHAPRGKSIRGAELAAQLGLDDDLPDLLLTARPRSLDPDCYELRAVEATEALQDSDIIDLGDRSLRVLHLPGHTPGSLGLFDEASGALFSGDVVYDDELLDQLIESDQGAYVRSMRRLRRLPVRMVYPGHGVPFDGRRMCDIIDGYLSSQAGT